MAGFTLDEVPVNHRPRVAGTSKMSPAIAAEAVLLVWKIRGAVR